MNSNQDRPWVVSESIKQQLQTVVDAAIQEIRVTHSCVPGLEVNVAGSTGRSMSPSDPTAIQMAQLTDSMTGNLHDLVKGILLRENAIRPINALPEELFWHIFDLLPVSSLFIASKVCSLWRSGLLGRTISWRELEIEYGECDEEHEVAATVWPWVVTCLRIHPTTNRPTYARAKHQFIDSIARADATPRERSHIYVWFTALMLQHLEMKLNSESIQNASTAQKFTGPIQLVFLSLITWNIPESVVELPSVRYLQVCCRDGESGSVPHLARLAKLCPNLSHLALDRAEKRFKIANLYKVEPTFHRLTITAPGVPHRLATLGIDLTLVPHLHIQCESSKNMDICQLLQQAFTSAAEVRVTGADRTIEGRTEDGRTFSWTDIQVDDNHILGPHSFDSCMVARFLRDVFHANSIVRMEIMNYRVRGATGDGREFLWNHLRPSEFSLFRPFFAGITMLRVDVVRLSNFREDMTMPNLVSLTVEIGEVVPMSVLRVLFGVGGAGKLLQWPTPELKELILELVPNGMADRQADFEAETRLIIEDLQLEHFVHNYLTVPPSRLTTIQLIGISLAQLTEHSSSLASIVHDTFQPIVCQTLAQRLEPNYNLSVHFIDNTLFYRYFRSADEEELAVSADFDLDADDDIEWKDLDDDDNDDINYEPDISVGTLMYPDSESDYGSAYAERMSDSDEDAENEDGDDEGHAEQAREPFSEVKSEEGEEGELSNNNSELKLELEIKDMRKDMWNWERHMDRHLHDFLLEDGLPLIKPFVTTFPGRQFKQLIVQSK